MTMITIKNPSKEDIAKFGPLAYVTKEERFAIMESTAFGQFKPTIAKLEKEIKELKKEKKKQDEIERFKSGSNRENLDKYAK